MQIVTTTEGSGLDVQILFSCRGSLNSANFAKRIGQSWGNPFREDENPQPSRGFLS